MPVAVTAGPTCCSGSRATAGNGTGGRRLLFRFSCRLILPGLFHSHAENDDGNSVAQRWRRNCANWRTSARLPYVPPARPPSGVPDSARDVTAIFDDPLTPLQATVPPSNTIQCDSHRAHTFRSGVRSGVPGISPRKARIICSSLRVADLLQVLSEFEEIAPNPWDIRVFLIPGTNRFAIEALLLRHFEQWRSSATRDSARQFSHAANDLLQRRLRCAGRNFAVANYAHGQSRWRNCHSRKNVCRDSCPKTRETAIAENVNPFT